MLYSIEVRCCEQKELFTNFSASQISSNDANKLEWFSRNSYRLALEISEPHLVDYAMRLLRVSAKVSLV